MGVVCLWGVSWRPQTENTTIFHASHSLMRSCTFLHSGTHAGTFNSTHTYLRHKTRSYSIMGTICDKKVLARPAPRGSSWRVAPTTMHISWLQISPSMPPALKPLRINNRIHVIAHLHGATMHILWICTTPFAKLLLLAVHDELYTTTLTHEVQTTHTPS